MYRLYENIFKIFFPIFSSTNTKKSTNEMCNGMKEKKMCNTLTEFINKLESIYERYDQNKKNGLMKQSGSFDEFIFDFGVLMVIFVGHTFLAFLGIKTIFINLYDLGTYLIT